jgi:preprotein translocase subunit YajC
MSFISSAYAQAVESGAVQAENPLLSFLPLILIFGVFYVFLIRPQQKKLKEHQEIINSIGNGDEVVTGGGIIGRITKTEKDSNIAHIEISDGVVVRINKATIVDVLSRKGETKSSEKKDSNSTPKKKSKATK